MREGGSARFLPVPVGAVLRGQEGTGGRELEFIVRSLVELKLQVEELRQRVDDGREVRDGRLDGGEVHAGGAAAGRRERDVERGDRAEGGAAGRRMS